jgi:hypothetical protein
MTAQFTRAVDSLADGNGADMHRDDNALTFVNGRCIEFAWSSARLRFEFVIALERRKSTR